MQIERAETESELDYHKRLIYGKLVDKTLADADYSELAKLAYGQEYSSDVARRMFYGSKKTLELIDKARIEQRKESDVADEIDAKLIELRKERQKFYDYRAAYSKMIRERAREEELNEIIRVCIAEGSLPELCSDGEPVGYHTGDNTFVEGRQ